MVDTKRNRMRKCFRLILEKKYSDAKNFLKNNDFQGVEINPGIKFAIEGIIDFLSDESKGKHLKDIEYLKELYRSFKHMILFVGSDDFDKEYFWTWISFLNFLRRQLKLKSNTKGIIDDPSEEPKSDEAT
ncbi:MAG: hypothetical protein QXL52_01125 [Nitrososphaerales archaeon]